MSDPDAEAFRREVARIMANHKPRRVAFEARWIGLRGHALGYHKRVFHQGTVRRWWFAGFIAKLRIATPPAGA